MLPQDPDTPLPIPTKHPKSLRILAILRHWNTSKHPTRPVPHDDGVECALAVRKRAVERLRKAFTRNRNAEVEKALPCEVYRKRMVGMHMGELRRKGEFSYPLPSVDDAIQTLRETRHRLRTDISTIITRSNPRLPTSHLTLQKPHPHRPPPLPLKHPPSRTRSNSTLPPHLDALHRRLMAQLQALNAHPPTDRLLPR
ncbi:hypothetical protein BC829DRAFT_413154 [Chytridium lagenaria]|nr:hypothetical protein BC829DRAFT_413154 [Chytridium lagenaria]